VALAPGVYNLFRKAVQTQSAAGVSGVQYQGRVVLFLVAGLFTMTGALAQLGVLSFLMDDIAAVGMLSPSTADFFKYLSIALQALLWVYAVASIVEAIHLQSTPAAEAVGSQPKRLLRAGIQGDATIANVKAALPDWPLL
jgi:hypothetical protein